MDREQAQLHKADKMRDFSGPCLFRSWTLSQGEGQFCGAELA